MERAKNKTRELLISSDVP